MNLETLSRPVADERPDAGLGRIRDQVAAAIADRRALTPCGAGTKAFLDGLADFAAVEAADPDEPGGDPVQRRVDTLDCTATRGIVDYEPTELYVTVRAGTTLAELQAALDEQRQYLPFEPPSFEGRATVGGMMATALCGPRRATAGSLRDYVLGTVLLDGRNRLMRFGGQVMKNVAGYDVSRLLAGSFGWLGVIAEVSLKVLPRPATEVTLVRQMTAAEAVRCFNEWAGQPLPISATSWFEGQAHLRLSGNEAAVDEAAGRIGGERLDAAAATAWWEDLREQRHPCFHSTDPLWRLSLPATTAPLDLGAEQLIEWGGALRWCAVPPSAATPQRIRAAAAAVGGTAGIHRLPPTAPDAYRGLPRLHPLPSQTARIHRRLKDAFDPHRIFQPSPQA
ncbi:MAG: glycolate oxidase subunit GlcE [Burkholderiaceae bacterium]